MEDVMLKQHVQTLQEVALALVKLDTPEMELLVMVMMKFD